MATETFKIMDIKKACEYLGISRITMYRIIKSKKIECFKIGDGRGIYKFAQADLDNYLSRHRLNSNDGKDG
ncbi:MAG: helix-turn-helix domain-containing protein [Candidatus Poribacteria bacterium]